MTITTLQVLLCSKLLTVSLNGLPTSKLNYCISVYVNFTLRFINGEFVNILDQVTYFKCELTRKANLKDLRD